MGSESSGGWALVWVHCPPSSSQCPPRSSQVLLVPSQHPPSAPLLPAMRVALSFLGRPMALALEENRARRHHRMGEGPGHSTRLGHPAWVGSHHPLGKDPQ